jgi:hypothetical protein
MQYSTVQYAVTGGDGERSTRTHTTRLVEVGVVKRGGDGGAVAAAAARYVAVAQRPGFEVRGRREQLPPAGVERSGREVILGPVLRLVRERL